MPHPIGWAEISDWHESDQSASITLATEVASNGSVVGAVVSRICDSSGQICSLQSLSIACDAGMSTSDKVLVRK